MKIFRITIEVSSLDEAAEMIKRPWGEQSFYVTDPWGNELCFVQEGTLYT